MTAKVISFPVDAGRSPSGRAGRASPEPASGLGHTATIANAAQRHERILSAIFGDTK